MSTVLVTGGYGLAGRDTVQRLVADGHHVVATAHRNTHGQRTDATDEILLIGGDDSHLIDQATVLRDFSAARGITDMPTGRPGDPASDSGWYAAGDWMDVTRAQQLLDFQHYTWPQLLDEVRANMGWKFAAAKVTAPVVRKILERRSPYRGRPGNYADIWDALRRRFGEARVDVR